MLEQFFLGKEMKMILTVLLSTLNVATITYGAPWRVDDKEPVDLHSYCMNVSGKETSQNKSPIILLHDAAMSLDHWRGTQQVIALQTGRKICALDLRNHGDSPWTTRTTVELMVKDLHHFLDKRNISKASFIGHGLGGMVAAQYALEYPSRVDSLVVEDMRPDSVTWKASIIYEEVWTVLDEAISRVDQGVSLEEGRKALAEEIENEIKRKYGDGFKILDENTAETLPIRCSGVEKEACKWKTNTKGMWEAVNKDRQFWDVNYEALYKGPSLFIYGDKSPMDVGKTSEYIEEQFTKAQFVDIREATHNLHGVHPEFNDEVIRFLKKHSNVIFTVSKI